MAKPDSLPSCRFCGAPLRDSVVDLGLSPLCEKYVAADQLDAPEPRYPLHLRICRVCLLAQVETFVSPDELFSEYAYFSSYSDSWVEHAGRFCAQIVERLALDPGTSRIVEVASNDGYLLQHFVARGFAVRGVEPAANVARAAVARGVPTEVRFFGRDTAAHVVDTFGAADLLVGNNVLAHVPDLNDFVAGLRQLLAPAGVLTMEFPHVVELIEQNQFDTIYHEHFSYFSFTTAERVFQAHGLRMFDVERIATHGGSLRVYAERAETAVHPVTDRVRDLRESERAAGYDRVETYARLESGAQAVRRGLVDFLTRARREGKTVAGYGAPGKGNTLLNYCGIGPDLLPFTVDRNPYKQGLYTPGMHIPIGHPDSIAETRPDYVLILPWNLRDEIARQLACVREWGGQFVVPIPGVELFRG